VKKHRDGIVPSAFETRLRPGGHGFIQSQSLGLRTYVPSDDDAAERFEKRKGRPPRSGEIRRHREKYERSVQDPDDSEPLDRFVRISTLLEVLQLIATLQQ